MASGTLKEAKLIGILEKTVRERRLPERFNSYVPLVTSIVESDPSSYEEATRQQVWREAMVEEYSSIMKNDV